MENFNDHTTPQKEYIDFTTHENNKKHIRDTEADNIKNRAMEIIKDIPPTLCFPVTLKEVLASVSGDIKDSKFYNQEQKNLIAKLTIDYLKKPDLLYQDVVTFVDFATNLIREETN